MTIDRLLTKPCTLFYIEPDGGADEYGNETTDVAYEGEIETVCYYEQAQADEKTIDQQTQIEEWKFALPIDTEPDGLSRIEVDDLTFEVSGPPWRVWNPRTRTDSHVELLAKRAE